MKMLIEFHMDGYTDEKEHFEACKEFIDEQLNFTASSFTILWAESPAKERG